MPPFRARGLLCKHWVFTLNNYTAADVSRLEGVGDAVQYLVAGREVGESGTPHLQGFVSFPNRKRLPFVKSFIGGRAHCEIARLVSNAIKYCKKDGDFFEVGVPPAKQGKRNDCEAFKNDVKGGETDHVVLRENHSAFWARNTGFCIQYVNDNRAPREVVAHPLYPWQVDLNARLIRPPDDRTVIFIVDKAGNSGKTWFAYYFESLHPKNTQVLIPSGHNHMAYMLNQDARCLFLDSPRSRDLEYLPYGFLEQCKNGRVMSTKYESCVKCFPGNVHVVVLMNEHPDMTKLSADRYCVIEVKSGE